MANFSFKTNSNNDRTAKFTATYPVAVPELGVAAGDPYPVETGALEVWFTAKRLRSDADADAVIQKTLTDGDVTVDGNIVYVKVNREDLDALRPITADVALFCDVQVKGRTGDVWTVAEGKWKFTVSVTQGA
jgi:hypothetical protein